MVFCKYPGQVQIEEMQIEIEDFMEMGVEGGSPSVHRKK